MPAPLRVFTILPNWADGMLERIGYLTDLRVSETGREHRRAVRRYPRRSLEVSFMRAGTIRQMIDNFVITQRKEPFYVPLWFEQYRPPAGLSAGATFIQFPADQLADREFRIGDWVIVQDRSPIQFETHQISAVSLVTNRISLSSAIINDWAACRVTPLRKCRIMQPPSLSQPIDRVGSTTILFEIEDPDTFYLPSWGHCSPLFRFRPNRADAIPIEYSDYVLTLDNETGVPYSFEPTDRVRVSESLAVLLFGRSNIVKFRRFIAAARGRQVRFWCPTFIQDATLADDISGSTDEVMIESNGLSEYLAPQAARSMVSFTFKDGRPPVYRLLTSITPVGIDGKRELITLDIAAPPIYKHEIDRIEFVLPCRFDQDQFELKHETDEGTAARTSLVVRSSDIEGMPPIDCWITSWPYPAEVIESIGPGLPLIGTAMMYDPRHFEFMESGLPLIGNGTLTSPLHVYDDWPFEGIDSTLPIVGDGELRTILLAYDDWPPDAIESTLPIISDGMLEVILISYDGWPIESFEIHNPVIGNGTLV